MQCFFPTIFLQGEMQQLRDKLAIAERTARSEAQVKVKMSVTLNLSYTLRQVHLLWNKFSYILWTQEKYQWRLKVLEDGLRGPPSGSSRPPTEGRNTSGGSSRRLSLGGERSSCREGLRWDSSGGVTYYKLLVIQKRLRIMKHGL